MSKLDSKSEACAMCHARKLQFWLSWSLPICFCCFDAAGFWSVAGPDLRLPSQSAGLTPRVRTMLASRTLDNLR